jgi:hypothetical protein
MNILLRDTGKMVFTKRFIIMPNAIHHLIHKLIISGRHPRTYIKREGTHSRAAKKEAERKEGKERGAEGWHMSHRINSAINFYGPRYASIL